MKRLLDTRRPLGRLCYLLLALLLAFSATYLEAQGPQTTQITDVVYKPDGTPARGTVLISWPSFSTSEGNAVVAGSMSVPLGTGGELSVALVPNVGADPAGTAYQVVYRLEGAAPSSEYWSVPTQGPTTIAAIRSKVVPQNVALQVVSRQYVDDQLALKAADALVLHKSGNESVAGVKTFSTSPIVPEPEAPAEAANKGYVDTHAGGGGSPGGADTQLQFNDAGTFAGDSGLTYNKTTRMLTAAGGFAGALTGNAASATKAGIRDKGFINVVEDCGLPTDGTTDATAPLRACRASHPGRHFVFPKLRDYNDGACDYQFSSAILTAADTDVTGEWYDGGGTSGQAENFPSAVKLCFAPGVTPFEIAGSGNGNFRLSNLHLYGNACYDSANNATQVLPFPWNPSGSDADGIRPHARVNIEHVWFECFGRHGVNFDTEAYVGNLNDSSVYMSRATSNRGAGLFLRGSDVNIGSYIGFDSSLNQMDGIVDFSQLGNYHAGHHTSTNGNDGTANGPNISLTNSVVTSGLATMTTGAPHGLVAGDSIYQGGTSGGLLNGRFQVLDVPSPTTYVVYTPQQDRASTAEAATVNKRSAQWSKALTGCSITSGSAFVTCASGGMEPAGIVGYPISILGAGAAGADLNTRTVLNGSKTYCSVTTWHIASNVLTVNCANSFAVGWKVKLFGFDYAELNDREVQVATASGTEFTAALTHADVASHANAARAYPPVVQLADTAGTTVSGANGTILYRPVAYRATTNANGAWVGNYMEADQNAALFSTSNVVLGGTMLLDTNAAGIPPSYVAGIGGVTTFRGQNFQFDTGNRAAALGVSFKPGKSNDTLLRFYKFNAATFVWDEGMRLDCGLGCYLQNVNAGGTRVAWNASAGGYFDIGATVNAAKIRLNYQGTSAVTGTSTCFYNGSTTERGCIDSAGAMSGITIASDAQLPTISTAGKVSDSALSANVSKLGPTVGGAELDNPAVGSKGGVEAKACSGSDKLSAIGTDGVPVCSADQTSAGGGVSSFNGRTGAVMPQAGDYASLSESLTNKTLDAEAAGNSITLPFYAQFAAAGCSNATASPLLDLPTANAPSASCLTGSNTQQGTLDFDDASAKSAQVSFLLPPDWSGAVDADLYWLVTSGGGSNAVKWTVSTACSASGATYDTAFNAAQTITSNVGSNNMLAVSSQAGITTTGCAPDSWLHIKIARDVTDTSTATARLVSVRFRFRRTM